MAGAIVMIVLLVLVVPISVLMLCAAIAGVLGWTLKDTSDKDHEGSELIELNN